MAGDWYSLYDGEWISDPTLLDIDHVVALKEAWDSGATLRARRIVLATGVTDVLPDVAGAAERTGVELADGRVITRSALFIRMVNRPKATETRMG